MTQTQNHENNRDRRHLLFMPWTLLIGLALASLIQSVVQGEMSAHAAPANCPKGATMNIVAHEDDDLLFLNPDLLHDIQAGRCVRTVYLTAGDAGEKQPYWSGREAGIRAAYANLSNTTDSYTETDAGIPNHPIPIFTLAGKPTVSLAFLRLPDGNMPGEGFAEYSYQSLRQLWQDTIPTITTVDKASHYQKQELIDTIASLLKSFGPDQVRTLDFLGQYDDADHSDHHTSAYLARAATQQYTTTHTLSAYQGYGISSKPENVLGADLLAKKEAFYAYARHDNHVCGNDTNCVGQPYEGWLRRQYKLASQQGGLMALCSTAAAKLRSMPRRSTLGAHFGAKPHGGDPGRCG